MRQSNQEMQVFGASPDDLLAVRTFYRAISGDPDLLDAAVTPDWQDIPLAPGQQSGREGMKPLIAAFKAAFADIEITIEDVIGAPGRLAVRAVMTGRHTGEWFGIAPSGKAFEMPIHECHRIENGKLTHTWHLEDWMSVFKQIGQLPTTLDAHPV